jgi:hypothetical protein
MLTHRRADIVRPSDSEGALPERADDGWIMVDPEVDNYW